MEQKGTSARQVEQNSGLPGQDAGADVTQAEANGGSGYDIEVRRAVVDPASNHAYREQDPIVLAVREILDLPRQILPEQTYFHLKNAAREATLAVVSLVNSLGGSTRGRSADNAPRRIDVE